ncbi:MAG: DNA polymerase III subunit delta' [Gammaproteobacteria bacterium]|nr:DNA polymerase III subunit delta' [Gammaproteobacteria bacterium]
MIYPWQQSQWQQINQLLKAERLPHAMILLGNEGLGKANFATLLASAVLCQQPTADLQACGVCKSCLLLAANPYPDLYHIKPAAPPNSKSKNPVTSIRIDDIRLLCEKLSQTSQYGGYRVAILEQAEKLTLSAANSLLKTLEEPGGNVLILLVSARPHRLPVTIRSRCQSLRFSEPDENISLQWLQQNSQTKASTAQLQQALKYAHGSPLAALEHLQDIEHHQLLSDAMTAGISGKNSLDYAAKLTKFDKVQTLEGMLNWVSDLSRLRACGADIDIINEQDRTKLQALANKVNDQQLFRFYDQLNFNLLHSSISVNEQLLWENLLLSWGNL